MSEKVKSDFYYREKYSWAFPFYVILSRFFFFWSFGNKFFSLLVLRPHATVRVLALFLKCPYFEIDFFLTHFYQALSLSLSRSLSLGITSSTSAPGQAYLNS